MRPRRSKEFKSNVSSEVGWQLYMKQITGEYVSLPILFVIDDPTVSVQVAAMQMGFSPFLCLGYKLSS